MTVVALNAGSSSLKYAVFGDTERADGDAVLRARSIGSELASPTTPPRCARCSKISSAVASRASGSRTGWCGGPEQRADDRRRRADRRLERDPVRAATSGRASRSLQFARGSATPRLRADTDFTERFPTSLCRFALPTHGSKPGSGATGSTAFRSSTSPHRSRRRSCAGPSLRISATAPAWSPYATAGRSTRRWA
jgi:hypothetical protein